MVEKSRVLESSFEDLRKKNEREIEELRREGLAEAEAAREAQRRQLSAEAAEAESRLVEQERGFRGRCEDEQQQLKKRAADLDEKADTLSRQEKGLQERLDKVERYEAECVPLSHLPPPLSLRLSLSPSPLSHFR